MRRTTRWILMAATVAGVMTPALARGEPQSEIGFRGWGPRIGLSVDPDQVHFGAHLDFGHFARHVRFQPNLELGLGEDVKLFAINAEAAYRFSSSWDVWSPYLGGGLGVNSWSSDSGGMDRSDTDLGVNLLGGIEKGLADGDRFFLEVKLSLNDHPDAKFTAGWTFYH